MRELLGGGRSQQKTSSADSVADGVAQSTITTVTAEARQPNSDLARLLQIGESSPANRKELARQVVGPLQRLCPQLEYLSPNEITQLVAVLGHLQVKDSLVDIVLEAVRCALHFHVQRIKASRKAFLRLCILVVQVSDIVADSVQQYKAPQLATICGAYVQLEHRYCRLKLFMPEPRKCCKWLRTADPHFAVINDEVLRILRVQGLWLHHAFRRHRGPSVAQFQGGLPHHLSPADVFSFYLLPPQAWRT